MTMRCDVDALSISGWKMTINMTIVGGVSGERSDPLHPTHGPHRQTQEHPSPESVRDERIGYSCGVNGSLLSSPVLTTCSRLLESEEEPVG